MELGPTVAEQAAYTLPTDFLLPHTVAVAGVPWTPSDRETVRQFEQGEAVLQALGGVYYEGTDEEGTRALYLYPTPSGGDTIEVTYVYSPAPLSVDEPAGEPTAFPTYWHPKLTHFAAAAYFETEEDNEELAQAQQAKADLAISDLTRYDNERSGGGPFLVAIQGATA